MPPESSTPTGTSATRCARTESRRRSRSSRRQRLPRLVAQLRGRRGPVGGVALEPRPPVLEHEHVARRQLADLAEDRARAVDGVEGEERLERVEVELAREAGQPPQRLELGGEGELARDVAVVQRLDPEAVAREHEPPARAVPHRDGEHPAQALGEARAVLLVEVDEHLGVGVRRAEHVARALELGAQLGVVVDLAVLDDDDAPVLARDRLVAALEVDDRQPPRGEPGLAVDDLAAAVGPAVHERRAHRAEHARGRRPARRCGRCRRCRTSSVGGPERPRQHEPRRLRR